MSKKDFVLQILEKIEGKWPTATQLRKVFLIGALDNAAINALVTLFNDMAVFVKHKETQTRMFQAAAALETMKHLELDDMITDQQDAERILL